jgi:cytidine deaminase
MSSESRSSIEQAALAARENAYCPYSNYRVGAALESDNGDIFTGCNIENAAYPAGTCAERVALGTAVAAGSRRFRRILIATDASEPTPPCGICRQALVEFAPDLEIVAISGGGRRVQWSLAELLPAPFTPASLENA